MSSAPFPPPPTDTIDWANVGFKVHEVNGHIQSTYTVDTGVWTPLRFVTSPMISIHGMAPALNYGQQAYEGLKAFRGPADTSIHLFRPDCNAVRLARSAAVVSMPKVPEHMFVAACRAATALNAAFVPPHATGAALYIRPQLYGSGPQLGLSPPPEYTFCVFVTPTGVYHGSHPVRCLILDAFDRAAPRGVGHAKVGGNYAPVLRWSDAARERGFDITLHLDSRVHEEIDEFSTSGFIAVKKTSPDAAHPEHMTLVFADSKCAIDSITSNSIQQIGQSFGWTVEKRPVKYSELPEFSEVMAAGTAAALVPIRSITRNLADAEGRSLSEQLGSHPRLSTTAETETITYIPDQQADADPVCQRLLAQLRNIQLGKVEDSFKWCFPVREEDGEGVEPEIPGRGTA